MKSKKSLFISTIVMVLVLVLALSTATYAWFAMQETVALNGLSINTTAAGGWEIAVWDRDSELSPYWSGTLSIDGEAWSGTQNTLSGSLDFSATATAFASMKGVTGNGVNMWVTDTADPEPAVAGVDKGIVADSQGFPYKLKAATANADFFTVDLALRNADAGTKDLALLNAGTTLTAVVTSLASTEAMAASARIAIFVLKTNGDIDTAKSDKGAVLVWEPFTSVFLDGVGNKQFGTTQYAIAGKLTAAGIAHNEASYLTQATGGYAITEDVSIVEGKTYYTRSGDDPEDYVYTPVVSPVVEDMNTYYEWTGTIIMPYSGGSVQTQVNKVESLKVTYATAYLRTTGIEGGTGGDTDVLGKDVLIAEDVEGFGYVYIRVVVWFEGQDYECLSASTGGGLQAAFTFGTPA
ncbi:MAG TPA: hypothetical protein P5058_04125 [Eubacteriales bacterium]|nr:hypothetical protein [Eubacteriales bacterium]